MKTGSHLVATRKEIPYNAVSRKANNYSMLVNFFYSGETH